MSLAVYSSRRRLGRITLAGGALTGSSPGLQDMADAAVRRAGGDVAAAYASLRNTTNGYLTIIPDLAEGGTGGTGTGPPGVGRPQAPA